MSHGRRRGSASIVGIAATVAAMIAAPAVGSPAMPPDDTPGKPPYHCDTRMGGGDFDYPGPSASRIYDRRFGSGPQLRHLGTHVPQGLAYWPDKDWFLVTAYAADGGRSLITALDRATGDQVGSVRISAGHVGGIGIGRGYAYVANQRPSVANVRRYGLAALARKLRRPGEPFVAAKDGERVRAASFATVRGSGLWVGRFDEDGYGRMYRYHLGRRGGIGNVTTSKRVPRKTQGVAVTGEYFFFSTSLGRDKRSNLYVQRRSSGKVRCFRAPSMSEGIATAGRRIYVAYESGARVYASDPDTRNPIKRLHDARRSDLTELSLTS
jgi:hypothetical protein